MLLTVEKSAFQLFAIEAIEDLHKHIKKVSIDFEKIHFPPSNLSDRTNGCLNR
jgi:hypothetical protein